MKLNAYYYAFNSTNVEMIDRILSAVACAGKAFHHTDEWLTGPLEPYEDFLRGNCCAEWIQNSAVDAANSHQELVAALERLTAEATGFLSQANHNDHGWTNMRVLQLKIDEARAVLAKVKG
jgi:hypothetical protein